MLGKLLRLDVHHDTPPLATVPPTNPYYVDGSAMNEYVWAVGLRNPWRFSFDRATGDLYIGGGCAVMGGYAYRGCAQPAFAGTYFFSDLCSSFVKTFEMAGGVATNITDRTDDAKSLGNSFTSVLSWGEDARGEIYVVAGNNGVYRIEPE